MKLFGEYLVEKKIVTASQLVAALIKQNAMLPSVAEVAFEKKIITPEQILAIFKIQHASKTGFIEAARELNIWNNEFHQDVEKHISSLRMPLGQILVEMTSIPLESITHALDEFLAEINEVPSSTSTVAPVAEKETSVETPISANIIDHSHFCEVLNEERKQTLFSSLSLMKAGDVSLSPLQTAKDILHILKGAARFAAVNQSESLIAIMESVIELIMNASIGKINPDTIAKTGEICQKGAEFLWDLSGKMQDGALEVDLLEQTEIKKSFETISASLEMIKFDLELL